MKVGIDINDVIRNYYNHTHSVLSDYFEKYPSEVHKKVLLKDVDDNYRLSKTFSFNDISEYNDLLYSELGFEISAKAPLVYNEAMTDLHKLYNKLVLKNHTVSIFTNEKEKAKSATYYFLGYNGCMVNNFKMVYDYSKIWSVYDIIVTANPYIIKKYNPKKKNKELFVISTPQNEGLNKGYRFETLAALLNLENNDNSRLLY